MGDGYNDPEVKLAYALSRGEIEPNSDEAPLEWMAEKARRFDEAPTREAKFDVLRDYMSERSALNALGIMLGERDGDVVWLPADADAEVTP